MTEIEIRNLMKKRGFNFEKKVVGEGYNLPDSYLFVNESEVNRYAEQVPLVEIFVDGKWHIYYRQNFMVGFMDSGEFGMLEDDVTFKRIYGMFDKQVKCLRDNLRNES